MKKVFMALFLSVMLVATFRGRLAKAELSAVGWSKIYVGTGYDQAQLWFRLMMADTH